VRLRPALLLWALGALAWGCAGPVTGLWPPAPGEPVRAIAVVNHGWHTGIVVSVKEIPEGAWPGHRDFPGAEYLEVGWGDHDFYQAPQASLWLAVKAAFWPSPSVLHVAAFRGPPWPGAERVEIELTEAGFSRLLAFIEAAYARGETGGPVPLGQGQTAWSRFYLGRERYFLLRTCNTWVARALRAAGCPITPLYALTAGNLMSQAGRCRAATGAR
jgi:uncharacterized protein (TIGR02117 family)